MKDANYQKCGNCYDNSLEMHNSQFLFYSWSKVVAHISLLK
jgi:hypothetical protein